MLRDAWLMARKDLSIEFHSKVVFGQIVPFGGLVLIMFGFAISPDLALVGDTRSVLTRVAPGLFWVTVLLAALLALGRSFAIESADGNLDALKMAGLDPAGIFIGKVVAVTAQLIVLEIVLGAGAFLLYATPLANLGLLLTVAFLATVAIVSVGTLYTALASGLRARDTLVPLLVMPVLAPVLVGATKGTELALFGPASDGWGWAAALALFLITYMGIGIFSLGSIMEES